MDYLRRYSAKDISRRDFLPELCTEMRKEYMVKNNNEERNQCEVGLRSDNKTKTPARNAIATPAVNIICEEVIICANVNKHSLCAASITAVYFN